MKQELASFLTTIDSELYSLTKYLYDNPEESFHEYKACKYITDLLKSYNFNTLTNYLDVNTAFFSQFGEGHPKICLICEYDADINYGHIYGFNAKTTISIGAALTLSKTISKIGGSVVLIGCPGELKSSLKSTMFKQGTFEDMDAILSAQPHVITAQSGTSMASLPLKLNFSSNNKMADIASSHWNFNTALIIFNALNYLISTSKASLDINNLSFSNLVDSDPKISEMAFTLNSVSSQNISDHELKIREFFKGLCSLLNIDFELHLSDAPCTELLSSSTLSRLFSHNLKECGIINIDKPKNLSSYLSLGIISHSIPCIHPYISITENSSVRYGTNFFADETITPYAHNIIMKTIKALAFTCIDLIENNSLLFEAKNELNNK
ncbi:amidohydrolase [Clostridium felsineum]|uniref:amidohydrolase n=1 Tax=Clostridium felsineum TaxID=36839 RepID=UPI00098C160F|nr:amidohydrolase [Clostridium felsineum]URZ18215.1 hypothetical protein CLFE_042700 [Clostridium felsineum DSM 794]